MNMLKREFGLLPASNRFCVRRKVIKTLTQSALLGAVLFATVYAYHQTAWAMAVEAYSDSIRSQYGQAVIAKNQAELDREMVIADANMSCGGGR